MATQSLKKMEDATGETPAATEQDKPVMTGELAERAPAELAKPLNMPHGVEGEVCPKDIAIPRLNLVQKMSELADTFKAGDFVYDKKVLLPQPLKLVVIHIRKQYQQDLPYGVEEMPDLCDTEAEVKERGGSTTYGDENYYHEVAHMQVLIQKPDGLQCSPEVESLFSYEFDGTPYAPAMFTTAKSAYRTAAKAVFTAAFGSLRDKGLASGLWSLSSDTRSNTMGTWHVPVMRPIGSAPDSVVAFAAGQNI